VTKTLGAVLVFFATVASEPLFSQAQAVNAQLNGTVLDPNEAVIPGARVTLSSAETGFSREYTTGAQGEYSFPLVPPGVYQLEIEAPGFKTWVQPDILLAIGQSMTIDPRLELGAVSETVEVQAVAPVLNTGNANVGSEVGTKQVEELPLNIRNVFGLVALESSVNNSQTFQALNPSGSQGNVDQDIAFFNFGGGRFGTTAFLLDGHWNGAGDWDGVIFVPSVQEIQEFKIETHTFSPQYGWSMGNVVNAITKSGTSSFHGGFFEFLRNDKLDANNFFNNKNGLERPIFQRNQFGAYAGGPVYIPGVYEQRNKTFIFGSWESLRQATPTTLITTVPTAAERAGDFSQSLNPNGSLTAIFNPFTTRRAPDGTFVRDPFPNNRIPQEMMDPVARNILGFWPDANRPGEQFTQQNNFAGVAGLPTEGDQGSVRADHNITDNQRIFGRWSKKSQFKQLRGEFFGSDNPGGIGTVAPNPRTDVGFQYTNVFSPTFIMNATVGWARWSEGREPQGVPFQVSSLGLPGELDGFGGPGAFPSISITGVESLGSGVLNSTPREARTAALDFTQIKGNHTMTFGFMGVDFRLNTFNSSQADFDFFRDFTTGPDPNQADPNTGVGMASFLLGTAGGGDGITLRARAAFNKNYFGWYFNDQWRITPKLLVNLGVRYDFQTAPTDRFDRLAFFNDDRNPISDAIGFDVFGGLEFVGGQNDRGIYDPDFDNIAPRIGITYRPAGSLVIRTGFGLFHTPAIEFGDYQGLVLNGFSQTTPFVGTLDGITPNNLLSNPFPSGLLPPPGKAGDSSLINLGQNVSAIERDRPTPVVQQWMFGLQSEVKGIGLEATYVGNHGTKLLFTPSFNRNQLRPELLSLGSGLLEPVPNPFFGTAAQTGVLSGPTVPRGQLLRQFPQFDRVFAVQPPAASSWYHAVNFSATRRFRNGIQFLFRFTASKYLTNSEGPEGWTQGRAQNAINFHDTSLEKSLMINDIPKAFVASYIYELPVGKGRAIEPRNKVVNALAGGWQIAGITTLKDGFPLAITAATGNTNSFNGNNQRPNLVGDPELDNPTIDRAFNIEAFDQPEPFTFGNVSRTMPNLRADGIVNFDFTLSKEFLLPMSETSRMQFRAEFFNLFNNVNFFAPNSVFGDPDFGRITSALPARSIQLALKLQW